MTPAELQALEEGAKRQIENFTRPSRATQRPAKEEKILGVVTTKRRPRAKPQPTKGIKVILNVKDRRIALDEHFVHQTSTISKLDARLQAERAARDAGWKYVGTVYDYVFPE